MSNVLSEDDLRHKLINLLKEDERTHNSLAECHGCLWFDKHPHVISGPNWAIARSEQFKRLPVEVQAAMRDAELAMQEEHQLGLMPLGLSTTS
ncbi:hypothetical protein [Paracidovorax wautersii]|uniref:hypothetical protein n=1 Tax=Paracidovorax wautersii TaxID=1177982 RepID=UPI001587C1E1|nr:hypothetical protein [Paracidovorax wautersii]